MNRKTLLIGCATASLAFGGCDMASAQTAATNGAGSGPAAAAAPASSTDQNQVNEIIVTANKREQSANSVGLTIQAATGAQLKSLGVSGPADLGKLVPGFTFTQSLFSTPVYTLRGIGLYDATFGAAPSVSIYTDQIPRNVPVMSGALDLDIERVEVLKGPQGTLFGQSSTGGAINYIVAKPTKDFHAGFDVSYERFDAAQLSGYVSGPVSDDVQFRLAGKAQTGGAWQTNIAQPNEKNGATRKLEGRLTVDMQPAPGLKIELMATGVRDRSDPLAPQFDGTNLDIYGSAAQLATSGNPYGHVDAAAYNALNNPASPGYDSSLAGRQAVVVGRLNGTNPQQAAYAAALLGTPISNNATDASYTPGLLGESHNDYYQFAGHIDYALSDTITLTSITALAKQTLDYAQSLSGVAAPVVDIPDLNGYVKTFNQELRLAGATPQLHWIVGGSYDHVSSGQFNSYDLAAYSANDGLINGTYNAFTGTQQTYAFFGNAEYKVTPQLTVQGGVRYTHDLLKATYCYSDPASDAGQGAAYLFGQLLNSVPINILAGQCFPTTGSLLTGNAVSTLTPVNQQLPEHNVSFRVGANYKFDQGTLLYATISQGYKAGIFSEIGASSVSQYTPAQQEKLIAYEVGFKAPLANRTIQLNGAAFYYDYYNKQVRGREYDPIFGLLEKLINVPRSYIYGVEGELVIRPLEGLRISGNATYLKSKITSNYSETPDGAAVYNAQGYTGNFEGSPLPYTPSFSANADMQYDFPVNKSLNGLVGGSLLYQGTENTTFHNATLLANDFFIPHYATLDARAGLTTPDGRWSMTVYGHNITNKVYDTAISAYLDTTIRYRGKPAIYGASLSFKY